MSEKYKVYEDRVLYHITFTLREWIISITILL